MSLYYLDIHNDEVTLDDEGKELADDHAARAYAVAAVRSLAADSVRCGHLVLSHRIDVVNAQRRVIFAVTFADAIDIRP